MDIKQLLQIGAQTFLSSIGEQEGSGLSTNKVASALADLLPGKGQNLDLGALIGQMKGGGLAAMAESWLGNGGNQSIDAGQILSLLGRDKIQGFAQQLGLGENSAVSGLQSALPKMIDQASSDGALDALGGVSGVLGMAGKLFGR